MKKMKILSFNDQYLYQCGKFGHSMIYDECPPDLKNHFQLSNDTHTYSLRSTSTDPTRLREPIINRNYFGTFLSKRCPKIWNEIPPTIKALADKKKFNSSYKKYLLDKYSTHVACTNPYCTDNRYHTVS